MIQINCTCIKSPYLYNHSNFFTHETPTTNHTNSPSSSIYSVLQNSIWQLFLVHSFRHDFAKTYVGISNYFVPNNTQGYYLNQNGTASTFNREGYMATAIDIGATHFWGFADLYVSINTIQLKFQDEKITNNFDFGTFTGLRIYPWALHSNKVRPFMGYKFSPFRYLQKSTNQEQFQNTKVKSVYDFGIGFNGTIYSQQRLTILPQTQALAPIFQNSKVLAIPSQNIGFNWR